MVQPSLAHRAGPRALALRAAARRAQSDQGRAERFLACAVSGFALQRRQRGQAEAAASVAASAAAAAAQPNGDGAEPAASAGPSPAPSSAPLGDDFFAHPFLVSGR